MPNNCTVPHARMRELTADELNLVHGGIIIIGGKALRPLDGNLTISGYQLNTIHRASARPLGYVI
jgi:hypothetical protein